MANVLEAVVSSVRALSAMEETSQQEQQQMEENQSQNQTAINIDAALAAKLPLEPPDVCSIISACITFKHVIFIYLYVCAQVSFDSMFREHETIKSPLRKCMRAVYYWLMVANYVFCYAVCGMPLIICWALLSSTSSYLYTFVLQPCLIIFQLWGSILMVPLRSIAKNLLKEPLRHAIRALCLR